MSTSISFQELIEPSRELAAENSAEIVLDEQEPESLIELDEREQAMEDVLHDLENLNAQGLLDLRLDSPLGQPNELQNVAESSNKPADEMLVPIGPLPAKEVENADVPAIPPPPGWKPKRDENRYASDLMELLSLDNPSSEADSFASDWSKLMATTSAAIPSTSTVMITSALPSQLLDYSPGESNFPNPFAEPVDPNFDVNFFHLFFDN
ncbi:unnamed protein product [Gongylonema pulchrum]|uniref:Clathrin_bdg domain-containing protein n=1 Tax=Gongylonema pulchrum TaxID=637853 RepID=A0A183EXC5_9BILA|nr:unnamed protein product [Gongylonema pulchrum]